MILIVLAAIFVFDAVRQREGQTGSNIHRLTRTFERPGQSHKLPVDLQRGSKHRAWNQS